MLTGGRNYPRGVFTAREFYLAERKAAFSGNGALQKYEVSSAVRLPRFWGDAFRNQWITTTDVRSLLLLVWVVFFVRRSARLERWKAPPPPLYTICHSVVGILTVKMKCDKQRREKTINTPGERIFLLSFFSPCLGTVVTARGVGGGSSMDAVLWSLDHGDIFVFPKLLLCGREKTTARKFPLLQQAREVSMWNTTWRVSFPTANQNRSSGWRKKGPSGGGGSSVPECQLVLSFILEPASHASPGSRIPHGGHTFIIH